MTQKIKNFIRGFIVTYIVLAISFAIGMFTFICAMSLFDDSFSISFTLNGYYFIAIAFITIAVWGTCKVIEKINNLKGCLTRKKEAKLSAE